MTKLEPDWYIPGKGSIVQLTLKGALEVAALKYDQKTPPSQPT